MSGPTLFIACNAEDYDVQTGTCAAPYYTLPPSFLPHLSAADGAMIAGAIISCWTLGAVFRVYVRVADSAKR